MNASDPHDTPPAAFYHEPSGALRFWVATGSARFIGATITREALHFLFQGKLSGDDAVTTYLQNRREIDDAVLRRVAAGSIEPVMLREADMPQRRRG